MTNYKRYVTKEIAGEYIETWDRKSHAIVSAEKCANLLNTKDAEIERLKGFAHRLAEQAVADVEAKDAEIERLTNERNEARQIVINLVGTWKAGDLPASINVKWWSKRYPWLNGIDAATDAAEGGK